MGPELVTDIDQNSSVAEEQEKETGLQVEKTLSVDKIYEKVQDYDLVFTAEASLRDALNTRLEEPILGHFATTPMIYILSNYQNQDVVKERGLFLEAVEQTDLSWKQTSYLLENIIQYWLETGELEAILDYEKFDNQPTRKIIEAIENTENVYSKMQDFQVDEEKDVAIVNPHQFNGLDKKVVPDDADEFSVFTDEKKEVPEFKFYNSTTEIVRAVQENITEENCQDVAIVINPESMYGSLIESALRSEGIPFMAQKGFSESEKLRTCLQLIQLSLSERVLVKECQPVLKRLDKTVSVKSNNDYLEEMENSELEDFESLLQEVREGTFGEAIELFEDELGEDCTELEDNLEELGILDQKVTEDNLSRIQYYLDTYDIESEKTSKGVLLASPKSSAYVDRPIVFYLGMDSSWNSSIPEKPWIDQEKQEDTNLRDFKTLIQNGEQQHFLVQEKQLNEEITPCLYFNELTDETIESFNNLKKEENQYTIDLSSQKQGFKKKEYDIDKKEVETISQSSLNKLAYCPKDYFFSKLTESADQEYFRKGSIFHDFAEFYVNHPETVEEKGDEKFIEMMLKEMSSIVDDLQKDILRTEFEVGIKNIKQFIDRTGFESQAELDGFTDREDENFFSDYFDKELEKNVTEAWFENPDLGVKGKADLVVSQNKIVDYKSGDRKTASSIVRKSNLELLDRKPNFQAMLYLVQLRSANPEQKLEFTFFHFLNNLDEEMSGGGELDDNIVTISYFPNRFNEGLLNEDIRDYLYSAKKRRSLIDNLGETGYSSVMEDLKLEKEAQYDKDLALEKHLEDFTDLCRAHITIGRGSGKLTENQLEKGCKSVLKQLVYFRKENYFKDDLDSFQEFLQDELDDLSQFQLDGFPLENSLEIKIDHSDLDHGDMIPR
ncbi:MAG: hypothetical protein BRC29_03640 [Nanohaloarchaea archaeon SW_7_43_1]|nr:MAG: hypothetical protein BRC29_03640 [Nanohaloarchaea archaeon SW_7_43_1]